MDTISAEVVVVIVAVVDCLQDDVELSQTRFANHLKDFSALVFLFKEVYHLENVVLSVVNMRQIVFHKVVKYSRIWLYNPWFSLQLKFFWKYGHVELLNVRNWLELCSIILWCKLFHIFLSP